MFFLRYVNSILFTFYIYPYFLYNYYMKRFLIKLIKIYQSIPGPWHNNCRHIPTCSNYAIDAIETYGALKGSCMAFKRIIRCNPWGTYGYDPIRKENDHEKNC